MARTRRGSHPGNAVRRKTSWEQGPGGQTNTTLTGNGATILGFGVFPTIPGLTIGRIRGLWGITFNAATAIGDGYTGAFGLGIVTVSVFTIGVTAVPAPIADAEWDGWMYHEFFDIRAGLDVALNSAILQQHTVDTKAMRKIPDEEYLLYGIIEVTEQGTAQIEVSFDSRFLVFLP